MTYKMNEKPSIKKQKTSTLQTIILNNRKNAAASVMTFKFDKKRIRIITNIKEVTKKCRGILYWMFRDARVQDNWAFLFAQKIAIKNRVPLHVCFCILSKFLSSTTRQYRFLLKGLNEVAIECNQLNINFHLLHGEPSLAIAEFISKYNIGGVVTDFSPLRLPIRWINDLKGMIPCEIPICQVDAHNIIPCWITSNKLEYSARTIRNKINSQIDQFLTEFPPVIKHPYKASEQFEDINWETALNDVQAESIAELTWLTPGYKAGINQFETFLMDRLKDYYLKRNDPVENVTSNLSPWFHFGMISVQRCIIEVQKYKCKFKQSVEAFMEEAIIRRELSDNFCFYNENYDNLQGANKWAIDTLNFHRNDKREYIYDLHELEASLTHDDLWNSAQNQLMCMGKMHGFLRMYWSKKILEWTRTPEQALEWSIYLNDKYSIDGCDPNGYVGCMWSICGIHDQGWKERNVFGKIRYMNYKGCQRKFNVAKFVADWGGKVHSKRKKKNA
ncbi:deoxyribodipyrimidine photo-lyase isoform X2 [Orussus abietinus]|uniref:deoxyribodipyrimidine photo-lyase isoform X2 n=1 Tax=Orussus abietinus TaxID=222816 RepID=UPI000624F86B|nr:deoxyribodipyrimidine photo-lyase isoform X2 [Orussus abietinus]